ncbi:MAG: double zinc ribbon domain-containing protein, partial [Firmicutes bacterium]|nr:double zinc ribbon domain-containing protein [Bacillota bacterium]
MGFFSTLLDLFFPPKCAFCHKVLDSGKSGVCARCKNSVARAEPQAVSDRGEVFTVCVSPLLYADTVKDSIRRFKFKGQTGYAKIYGKFIAE